MSFPKAIDSRFLDAYESSETVTELKAITADLNKVFGALKDVQQLKYADIAQRIQDHRDNLDVLGVHVFAPEAKQIIAGIKQLGDLQRDDAERARIRGLLSDDDFFTKLMQVIDTSDKSPEIKAQEKARLEKHRAIIKDFPDVACMNAIDFVMVIQLVETAITMIDRALESLRPDAQQVTEDFIQVLQGRKQELKDLRPPLQGYIRVLLEVNDKSVMQDSLASSWLLVQADETEDLSISNLDASSLLNSWIETGNKRIHGLKNSILNVLKEVTTTSRSDLLQSHRLNESVIEHPIARHVRSDSQESLPRLGDYLQAYLERDFSEEECAQSTKEPQGWAERFWTLLGYDLENPDTYQKESQAVKQDSVDLLLNNFSDALNAEMPNPERILLTICRDEAHPNHGKLIKIYPQLEIILKKVQDLSGRNQDTASDAAKKLLQDILAKDVAPKNFERNCKDKIVDARQVLKSHRGFKKIFVNLAQAITCSSFRFFKTDSEKKLDKLQQAIETSQAPTRL